MSTAMTTGTVADSKDGHLSRAMKTTPVARPPNPSNKAPLLYNMLSQN
jgi:hypothetical protein